jgi:23S rRNA A1618 N6-methylase RlmF
MTAFEPIIAAILGSGVTAGVAWIVKQIAEHKALEYGPIVARAYDIIDPLLEQHMQAWGGSDVEFAIELAIEAIADGEITGNEIKVAAREASSRWLPAVAAEKVRKYVTASNPPAELKAADTLADTVNGIISKEEGLTKTREILSK